MERNLQIVVILVTLIILYTGFAYLQERHPTGYGVLESGTVDVLGLLNLSSFNTTDGASLLAREAITLHNFTAYNGSALISAFKGNSNKTDKVIADDGQEFELEKEDVLNVTFAGSLSEGDVVTIYSDDASDKGLHVCRSDGNCNLTLREFNANLRVYNFTLLGALGERFYLDGNKTAKIDAVFAFKKNIFFYNASDWSYPAEDSATSSKISLPGVGTLHGLVVEQSLHNQSLKYEYSTDQQTWGIMTAPLDKSIRDFWLRISWYSDGLATPVLRSVRVNYTSCIRECFPSRIQINRTADISLMPNETAFVNATFTGLTILPGGFELNKTLSVFEYQESNVSSVYKPAKRFVDLDGNLSANTSFTLRLAYADEELIAGNIQEESLKIYYFNASSASWGALPSIVSVDENYVEAALEHLSTYGLFGEEPTPAAGSSGGGGGGRSSRRKVYEERPVPVQETSTSTTLALIPATLEEARETSLPLREITAAPARNAAIPEFRSITGRFADAGRRVLHSPPLLTLVGIFLAATGYLLWRALWLRRASRRKG